MQETHTRTRAKTGTWPCVYFQMIMEQLEQERGMLASSMAEKVREHQELLQVKMDLGMEVAAYR